MTRLKAYQLPSMENDKFARWDMDEITIYLNKQTGEFSGEYIDSWDLDNADCNETPIPAHEAENIARNKTLYLKSGITAYQVR